MASSGGGKWKGKYYTAKAVAQMSAEDRAAFNARKQAAKSQKSGIAGEHDSAWWQAHPRELANYLNNQHPNTWDRGAWYPARLPTGEGVSIRRSKPVAGNRGWIHVRRGGMQYRMNVETGAFQRLE